MNTTLQATSTKSIIFTDAAGDYTTNGFGVRDAAGAWLSFPADNGTIHAWPKKSTAKLVADTVDASGIVWVMPRA